MKTIKTNGGKHMIKGKKFQCTVHKKRKFWNYFNCSSNLNNSNANISGYKFKCSNR